MEEKDIAAMMLAFADEAVKMGREGFEMELDFSENSLQKVEQILAHLSNEMPESAGEAAIDEMSKVWGGYLGEVVRRRWGGEWTIDYYPGGAVPDHYSECERVEAVPVHESESAFDGRAAGKCVGFL